LTTTSDFIVGDKLIPVHYPEPQFEPTVETQVRKRDGVDRERENLHFRSFFDLKALQMEPAFSLAPAICCQCQNTQRERERERDDLGFVLLLLLGLDCSPSTRIALLGAAPRSRDNTVIAYVL